MPFEYLNVTDNPCLACGKRETIGVGYGHPEATKFWCADHLPDEFKPRPNALPVNIEEQWADAMATLNEEAEIKEAKLREGYGHD
jgi:hypothetical protein